MAERLSELPPEQNSSSKQQFRLQERFGAHDAVSPQLQSSVHPAVRDHHVVRGGPEHLCSLQADLGQTVLQILNSADREGGCDLPRVLCFLCSDPLFGLTLVSENV